MIKRIVLSTDQAKLSKVMTAQVGQPLDPEKIREHARVTDLFMLQCNVTSFILGHLAEHPDDAIEPVFKNKTEAVYLKDVLNKKITSWESNDVNSNHQDEVGHTLQMDDITLSIVVTGDHAK